MRFSIDRSRTPIYDRIALAIASSLSRQGHTVNVAGVDEHGTLKSYLQQLDRKSVDIVLVANLYGINTQYISEEEAFVFELIPHRLVFLHYDYCMSTPPWASTERLIEAYKKTSKRSHHLCIEHNDCLELAELGIESAHWIQHATEFNMQPSARLSEDLVSFVGHALEPTLNGYPTDHRISRDYWNRVCDLTYSVKPAASAFAKSVCGAPSDTTASLAAKTEYLLSLHNLSLHLRGDVLKRAGSHLINIYGGDPSYLHGKDMQRNIRGNNFIHHPPTNTPKEAAQIYNMSTVSINITPFQFDTAVINRVIDIAAAGGLPLTDWKEDLPKMTSAHKEISYCSPEELSYKIEYYTHPDNQEERLDICHCLHAEMQARFTYDQMTSTLLNIISARKEDGFRPLKVDLGCGTNKADGYFGVDQYPSSCVDKIADLSRRFPFASNSVDHVRAHDIIEHLPDRIHTMNEIWRICKDQSIVDIRVPSTDGRGAFQDPTHVSFWNANSFYYYCPQYPAYFQLCQAYGLIGQYEIISLDEETSSDHVIHLSVKLKAIKNASGIDADRQELIEGLRDCNALLESPEFNEKTYEQLKALLQEILKNPRRGSITLFIDSESLASEEVVAMLAQLMFDLIAAGDVGDGIEFPNLYPAPRTPDLQSILESRLTYKGTLTAEDAQQLIALLNRERPG